jgi:type IV pilus assembly protein PilE
VATKLRRGKQPLFFFASGGLVALAALVTMRRVLGGFSLIELLFVMAVIAILSSFALPSYQHTQQKGQRTLAKLALAKTAHWLERAASISGNYPSAVPDSVWQSSELRYRLQVQSQAQSFTLIATPLGVHAQDDCGSLTLGHTGERGVQNAVLSASQCWER